MRRRRIFSNDEIKAMLLDRHWILTLPEETRCGALQRNSFIASMVVRILTKHHTEARHCALIDNNSHIHPGLMIWNPKSEMEAGFIRADPLLTLTPKEFRRRAEPTLYPDLTSLQIDNNPIAHIEALGVKYTSPEIMPPSHGTHNPFTHKRPFVPGSGSSIRPINEKEGEYQYENCFLFLPHELPQQEEVQEECERMCNIRGIEEANFEKMCKEASNNETWTPSTLRLRRVLVEVICGILPQTVAFAFEFRDKEGNIV